MAKKVCSTCGRLSETGANFCSSCGAHEFSTTPPRLDRRASQTPASAASTAVYLSPARVLLLSLMSAGLYLFYWLYLTWRQLRTETGGDHYPIWHALSLFIPVYGLFRLHRHVGVIRDLAMTAGLEMTFTPGLAALLFALNWMLGLGSAQVEDLLVLLLLNTISLTLTTTLTMGVQDGLNRYWMATKGESLQKAPVGIGETVFALLGMLYWTNILFSILRG